MTSLNLRIFKGLSLQVSGGVAYINDQINLKKGGISDADRLLNSGNFQPNTGYREG